MPLATYSQLVAAVQAEFFDNANLTGSVVGVRVALAEAWINRNLRVRDQLERATALIGADGADDDQLAYFALPSDFLGMKSVEIVIEDQDEPAVLGWRDADDLARLAAEDDTRGTPQFYTLKRGEVRVWPVPDVEYTCQIHYFQRIPALDASNTTNWLLERHPDAYYYATCASAAAFLRDNEAAANYTALAAQAIADITAEDGREEEIAARSGRFSTLQADTSLLPRCASYDSATNA